MFKNHINLLAVNWDKKILSVGIGLLCYSLDYITCRLPDSKLKLDIIFIEEKIELTFQPVPMSNVN